MSVIHSLTTTANDLVNLLPTDVIAAECDTGQGGFLGKACDKGNQLETLMKALVTVIAVIFVIYKAVSSKFALGTIVVSALVAGLLIWIVNSTDTLFNWTKDELGNGEAQGVVETVDSVPSALGTGGVLTL